MKRAFLLKQRGDIWYVRYAGEDTFHSTGLTNRDRAEDFAYRQIHEHSVRQDIIRGAIFTLEDFTHDFFQWDTCRWVARQRAKKRSFTRAVADNRRAHLVNHILPKFGQIKLCDLTAVNIEDWLVSLPLANQTRNHILYSLSIVLREAKRDGIIDRNPAEDVEPMGGDSRPTSALTDDELSALFPAEPEAFRAVWPAFQFGVMFALMVSSGMRPGEARALEWSSVLLDIPAVLVVQAVNASDELGPTKGKERRGAIIPDRTAALLQRWREMSGMDPGFVFRSIHGGFHSRKATHNRFREGLVRAGIDWEDRRISLRCLRTTYNTRMRQLLLANAMPEDLLRFFIGHRSVRMTDRYDNPELEAKLRSMQQMRNQIDDLWNLQDSAGAKCP